MPQLRLYLLGAPRVELNTQPVPLTARKGMALLAYLTITQRVQQRNTLATLLWPELGQQSARAALRRELHTLTNAIGDDFILATRSEMSLLPTADVWTDVAAFQQRMAEWSHHHHAGGVLCEQCMDALASAVALYRGQFLADLTLPDCLEFEEWRVFQADGLRRTFTRVVEALVQEQERRGAYATALEEARRWLETEPLHEPIHRELMRLYALAGQHGAALRQYEECVRILNDELGIAPEAATTELYASIRTRRFPPPERMPAPTNDPAPQTLRINHNLPTQITSFVGRQDELASIADLLQENEACRLLTLLGPGGIGKTRLALQVAQHLVDAGQSAFLDGIYFVPLASLVDEAEVVRAIANAVGYTFTGVEASQTQLENFLRTGRMLLVVDNFEHLLDGAGILSELLAAAPGLSILVTSRETLNLAEEWLYPVGGLQAPSGDETLKEQEENSAVQLFVERARRMDASFAFTPENAEHVVRICQLVDGMPLGLELAAAWAQMLSAEEIAGEIASSLDILASELRNIPERHRSLRAIFEQTWQRLSAREQRALRRLAVFRGTFTRVAAEQITETSLLDISSLVDKALCRYQDGRYDVHELLRQFAFERMDAAEAQTMQRQHSQYFGTLLASQQQCVMTAAEDEMLQTMTAEFDNILAAWRYLTELLQNDSDVARWTALLGDYVPVLAVYFDRRSLFWEGQRIFQEATNGIEAAADSGGHRAVSMRNLLDILRIEQAGILMHLGHYQAVKEHLLELLPQLRSEADPHRLATALSYLGPAHMRLGAYAEAERYLEEAIALYEQLDMRLKSTLPLINMGLTKTRTGQYAEARACYEKAVTIYETVGYTTGLARCLSNIGSTYPGKENVHKAISYYERAYDIVRGANNRLWHGIIVTNLADCARVLGNYHEAREKFAEGLALFRQLREMRWVTVTLADSSFTLIALADFETAVSHLKEALQLALEYQLINDGLQALSATALLLQRQLQYEAAAAIAAHVRANARSHRTARENVEEILCDVANVLPKSTLAAAQFRGESTPLALMIPDAIRKLERLSIS